MSQETKVIEKHDVVVRFSGDSGDGMQLTGQQFSDTAALFGNDVATFPDYPAEIRAPQGTVGGVSGFQVHIGDESVKTQGTILCAGRLFCYHAFIILMSESRNLFALFVYVVTALAVAIGRLSRFRTGCSLCFFVY